MRARSRRDIAIALMAAVVSGCLLTSNFDDIAGSSVEASDTPRAADGEPTEAGASSGAPTDAATPPSDGAQSAWAAVPCRGRELCLSFDEGELPPAGWDIELQSNGQLARSTTLFATPPAALHARVSRDFDAGQHGALLFRTVLTDAPARELRWGFDAFVSSCSSGVGNDGQGSITFSALQPSDAAIFGLVVAATADHLAYTPTAGGAPTLYDLPQRLPRGAWFHLDFELAMASSATIMRVALDGALLRAVTYPGVIASSSILLNVGLRATSPIQDCEAVYDEYYFERVF